MSYPGVVKTYAIQAGRDGKVTSIAVAPGDSVLEGTVLLTIE